MTRKPQIAWGLRVKTPRGSFIYPGSIRWRRRNAFSVFWRDFENYSLQARANMEQKFKDGTLRFVKVQIIPVEGEDD